MFYWRKRLEMRQKFLLTGLIASLVISAGCEAPNNDPKTLVVYSGRNEKLISSLIEQAEKDLKLDIDVRYGDTSELAIALVEEGENSNADVFLPKMRVLWVVWSRTNKP